LVGTKWAKHDLAGYLPVDTFFPHLACRGERTTTIKDRPRVDDLHMRGIFVANRWKKLRTFLDRHIAQNADLYVTDIICNIHVERLDPAKDVYDAIEYVLDGLEDRTFIPDDIMILDLGISSLRPSAWPDLDTCSGCDGLAVFPC
jgi:hypothetical protein